MDASERRWTVEWRTLARVGLAALAVRAFGLVLLFGASAGTDVRDYTEFLSLEPDESRAERLQALHEDPARRLAPFDGQFYLDIAERGYHRFERWPQGNAAFFPLYPLLLATIRVSGSPVERTAALLNCVLSAGAAIALWLLAESHGARGRGWIAVALFLAWPAAPFQFLVYSESLFAIITFAIPVLLHRNRDEIAAIAAFLAGLARPQGVLVGLLFLARPVATGGPSRSCRQRALLGLAPCAGLLIHMAILAACVDSPWAFLDAQASWGRESHPLGVVYAILKIGRGECFAADGLSAAIGLLAIPVLLRTLPLPLALFGIASVLLPLSTGTPLSMGRFLSVAFPIFLAAGSSLRDRPRLLAMIVFLASALQIAFIQRLAAWEFAG